MALLLSAALACRPGASSGSSPVGTGDESSTTSSTPSTTPALTFDGPVPRNLLVISVDTLRRDHLGRWDPEHRGLTPFLDGLLDQGVVVRDATACADWTAASTACVMSGASNVDRADARGMVPILTNDNVVQEAFPDEPSLAGWLGEQGYDSLLVSANDWMSGRWNASQHFARVDEEPGVTATTLWEDAKRDLDQQPLASPFYLHLHFFEPHRPWDAPAAYLGELDELPDPGVPLDTGAEQTWVSTHLSSYPPDQQAAIVANLQARYRGEVRWLDDQLSAVWAELEARGLLDDTLVLFWTDHGEALWETGYTGHAWFLGPNENDIVVAFWAKNLRPGTVEAPVEAIDLTPTVLATFGFPIPSTITGVPVGERSADDLRTAFTDAFGGPVSSARQGRYLLQFGWAATDTPILLHDVVADPATQHDLYDPAAPSDVARALWAALRPEILVAAPYVAADPRGYTLVLPPELEAR